MIKTHKSLIDSQDPGVYGAADRFVLQSLTADDASLTGAAGSVSINQSKYVTTSPDEVRTTLRKRAKRVSIAKPLAAALVRAAQGPLMGNAYARTLHQCGSMLEQRAGTGRMKTYFCGYRHCPTCSAIRSAKVWHGYGAAVSSFRDPWMITLTAPNVSGKLLRQTIRNFHKVFHDVTRSARRAGLDVRGVRSTEITYSKKRDDYHPHIHAIFEGREVANFIRLGWLKRFPDASSLGQDMRRADRGAIAEIFKYATKTLTDTTDPVDGGRDVVPAEKLDVIFTSIRKLRLFAAIGIQSATGKKETTDDEEPLDVEAGTPAIIRPHENVAWHWLQELMNYGDLESGEMLTDFEPTETHRRFVDKLNRM